MRYFKTCFLERQLKIFEPDQSMVNLRIDYNIKIRANDRFLPMHVLVDTAG